MASMIFSELFSELFDAGVRLGRPFGSVNKTHVWNGKEKQILRLLKQGVGKTQIARATGMGVGSVYAFLSMRENERIISG